MRDNATDRDADEPSRSAEEARRRLHEVLRIIHIALPQSELPVRQRVEVRRDLLYLLAESQRQVFRPVVAQVVCDAVLDEVLAALPERHHRAIESLRSSR